MRGELIVVAGAEPTAYMKFSDASLAELSAMAEQRGPAVAERMRGNIARARGKYVQAPPGPKGAQAVAGSCRIGRFTASMEGETGGTRALPSVRRAGHRMVPLVPPSDDKSDSGTVYVEADGKPYMRSMEGTLDGEPVSVEFSDYGTPVHAQRPGPAQIADIQRDDGSLFAA
ncbi:hypothetical protein ACIBUY_18965 [Streptomyces sp. NPDC050085]